MNNRPTNSHPRWQHVIPAVRRLVMYGAADQARMNYPILRELGCEVVALIDDTPGLTSPFSGVPLLAGFDAFKSWTSGESALGFSVAIGNPHARARLEKAAALASLGLMAVSFADPSSLISSTAKIGDGLQAMPRAYVGEDTIIGRQVILNAGCIVEHDCVLGDGVEIAPGAILCGRVTVGERTWVCAGATVRDRVSIGKDCIVGAGATVVADIPDGTRVFGTPARAAD